MSVTVLDLLIVLALLTTLASIVGPKTPLWIPVFLLCLVELIRIVPVR